MTQLLGTDIIHKQMLDNIKYVKKDKLVTLRLSEPDYKDLIKIAKKYDINLSTFVRIWIQSVIDYESAITELEKNENIL